jgi:membrane associated rhomboid family serine protease
MFFENQFRDNQPIGNFRGFPVYITTIFVAIIVVGLIFSAVAGISRAFSLFAFEPELFWRHGQIWRLVSYLAVDQVSFFTLFNLMFLYTFGRDCEKEMGRGRYLAFLGLLVLTPGLIATLLWLLGIGGGVNGSIHLAMGLVIGFATIYPNVPWWGEIPMRFVAVGCMFLAAVGHLSQGDQIGLGSTLATCAVSFGYIRGIRAGFFSGFSWTMPFRRRRPVARPTVRPKETAGDVDALLDKIAKSGFHSLTASEKARLEAAREELLRRNRR